MLTKWLTFIAILANATGMITPVINAGDSVTYAALSHHIAQSGNWMNLVLDGKEWLDKPHFPFWMTALFFKLGGVSAFTYILPGFLFHLLGGYYTYRIARLFYGREAAWLSVLVYSSVFHIMSASSDVKAETYLTGSIMAACYYWLRYDTAPKLKFLLLGAIFSGISVMTKGVFTLITIGSGFVCMWIFMAQWHKLWSGKWILALCLSLLCTAPELIAVYTQFDAHPEKLVFGRTNVSGVKFFLWDSQFGRFFNTGPITNTNGNPIFFVHVFLWAFLPWVAVYFAAMFQQLRNFTKLNPSDRSYFVFLCGAFFVTFVLFSATSFQLDHYTIILFPFAAIVCGKFLSTCCSAPQQHRALYIAQIGVTVLVVALVGAMAWYTQSTITSALATLWVLAALVYVWHKRARGYANVMLVLPTLAGVLLYVYITVLMTLAYMSVGLAYNVNKQLESLPPAPVYVWGMGINSQELAIYSANPVSGLENMAQLSAMTEPHYVILRAEQLASLQQTTAKVQQVGQGWWAIDKTGLLPRMLRLAKGVEPLDDIRIVQVQPNAK